MDKKVIVVPYDESWKSAFEKIKEEIMGALGDLIIGIEHVGSTSVEGLSAKPCIDIDVIIKDYSVFDVVVSKLEMIGYTHTGNQGIKDREAFKYSDKPHLQKHHLYVCPQQSEELYRHITFRDYLRSTPEAVKQYGFVKETAAQLFPDDIEKYMEYKSPCIEELYELCGLNYRNIVIFKTDMQPQVEYFFEKCFSAVGIPYSPENRHADIADIEQCYMKNGCFWCLVDNDTIIGTIAIRVLDADNRIVELKRMFVLPEHQGKGHGRLLLEYAIAYSKEQGYQKMCLDTRRQFSAAQHLYRSAGFRETDKYNDNEHAELYFELIL